MFDKVFVVQAIIAVLECTPPITTHNKAMPSLSYRVKVSRYIETCISDHLYQKAIYMLQLNYTSLMYNTKASTLSSKSKNGPY